MLGNNDTEQLYIILTFYKDQIPDVITKSFICKGQQVFPFKTCWRWRTLQQALLCTSPPNLSAEPER